MNSGQTILDNRLVIRLVRRQKKIDDKLFFLYSCYVNTQYVQIVGTWSSKKKNKRDNLARCSKPKLNFHSPLEKISIQNYEPNKHKITTFALIPHPRGIDLLTIIWLLVKLNFPSFSRSISCYTHIDFQPSLSKFLFYKFLETLSSNGIRNISGIKLMPNILYSYWLLQFI